MSRSAALAAAVAREQPKVYRIPGTNLIARVVHLPSMGEQLDDLYRSRAARYGDRCALD